MANFVEKCICASLLGQPCNSSFLLCWTELGKKSAKLQGMAGTGKNRLCVSTAHSSINRICFLVSDEPGTPLLGRQKPHPRKSGNRHIWCPSSSSPSPYTQGSLALQNFRHLTDGVQHPTLRCDALYLWGILAFWSRWGKAKETFPTLTSWWVNTKAVWSTERWGIQTGSWWPGFESSSTTVLVRVSVIINKETPKSQQLNITQLYCLLGSLSCVLLAKRPSSLQLIGTQAHSIPQPCQHPGPWSQQVREECGVKVWRCVFNAHLPATDQTQSHDLACCKGGWEV